MSRTGVIVALAVCVTLALAALFLMRSPQQPSVSGGPLLKFEPATLATIEVRREGGVVERARRIGGSAWVIELGDQPPWPANPDRIRAGIRILSTLEAARSAEPGDEPGAGAAEVRLVLDEGGTRVLRISPQAMGGSVLIAAENGEEQRAAWVDGGIADMFVGTGLGPWRDTGAMGSIGAEVSRVRLQGSKGTIELGRVRGRWGVTAPVAEVADPDAVAKLFSLIGQARVQDFLDRSIPAAMGLEEPVAVLTLESDSRKPDEPASVMTVVRTLEVGRTADVAGRTVYARLKGSAGVSGEGPEWSRIVVVDGQPLAQISTSPAGYISRRAVHMARADIGTVTMTVPRLPSREFRRTLDGWARPQNGQNIPLSADDLAGVRGLLDLLTEPTATAVVLGSAESWVEVAKVELLTLGGDPVAEFGLGTAKGATLAIRKGDVWWLYSAPGGERFLRWLVPG